jgi:hypothetical protein
MEAEHYQTSVAASSGHEWLPAGAEFGGYSGTGALRALPEDNVSNNTSYANVSPRLDYQVNFALTGTHYIWVRMQAPSLGSDSFHVGLNGQEVGNGTNMRGPVTGGYVWAGTKANGSRASLSIGTAGLHTVNVWMRESGTVIDKVILTPDAAFDPSTINGGLGPNETTAAVTTVKSPVVSPNGGVFTNPVSVSLSTETPGAAIYYTIDGSVPTTGSTHYTAPFLVAVNTTVKTRAFRTGLQRQRGLVSGVPDSGATATGGVDRLSGDSTKPAVPAMPAWPEVRPLPVPHARRRWLAGSAEPSSSTVRPTRSMSRTITVRSTGPTVNASASRPGSRRDSPCRL